MNGTHDIDRWTALRRHTAARIALGRAGASLPTRAVLDFAVAHATARDAVHATLDVTALCEELTGLGVPMVSLSTRCTDRRTYLCRPDLGRRLDSTSRDLLAAKRGESFDVIFVIGDGLSAPAPQQHSGALLRAILPMLKADGLQVGPICIVQQARVAVQDEIGEALGAKVSVILIGERPGLGTADSLGSYLIFNPRPGRTDAQRNCISNIRPGGLNPALAASTLRYLISESLRRQLSGVALKDDRPAAMFTDDQNALPKRP